MIYRYIRFSTDKQDERQQENKINNYLEKKGMKADKTYIDAGVSGGKSYKDRELFELCKQLKKGDAIIVSELSRITRNGIIELCDIIEHYFKPNKLRLIICDAYFDMDCSDINPFAEMQLMFLAMNARIEKISIADRTKQALEARKKAGQEIGGTKKLWGSKNGNSNRIKAISEASQASAQSRREKARMNPANKAFWEFISDYQAIHGRITANTDFQPISDELNKRGKVTSRGLTFDKKHARAMYVSLKNIYEL